MKLGGALMVTPHYVILYNNNIMNILAQVKMDQILFTVCFKFNKGTDGKIDRIKDSI